MASLHTIVETLDKLLRTSEIADYSGAMNGLQLENRSNTVSKVASAVDASLPVIKKAIAAGADLLIVHHGLFWHGTQNLTGPTFQKFNAAIEANLAIYSSHLPLDIHPEHGNNALLAEALGLKDQSEFGDFKGNPIGIKGHLSESLDTLLKKLEGILQNQVHHCPGRGQDLGTVGIVTGGAGSQIQDFKDLGIDTLVTGEGPHWSYPLAEELEKNLIYAGHYATETFGVRSLGRFLVERFSLNHEFVDHPTGL